MYRAGIEGLIGLTREADRLRLAPCLPRDWPEVTVRVRQGECRMTITITNPGGGTGIASAQVNDQEQPVEGALILPLTPGDHRVKVTLNGAS